MKTRIGINGFGRIGRLTFRVARQLNEFEFIKINDPSGDTATLSHLLNFDSVHGQWSKEATHNSAEIIVDNSAIDCSQKNEISDTDWSDCDLVIDASGKFRSPATVL